MAILGFDRNSNELQKVYKRVGANISYLRKQRNLTQESLAAELNISSQALISQYENARKTLTLEKIMEFCAYFIMEAELTRDARHWYLRKANAGGLSKAELLEMIESAAHLEKSLDAAPDTCYTDKKRKDSALRRHAAIVSQRQPFQSLFVVPLYDVLLRFIHRKKRRSLHARC